jgi:hypothetical protein
MKSRTRAFAVLGLLVAAVGASSGIASCEVADRSSRAIDSSQPRDLINQPHCWPADQSDSSYCNLTKI